MSDSAKVRFLDLNALHAGMRAELDAAVARVIAHGQFINGPELKEFERAWATWCGAEHAVGVANGTAGLHALLHACGVQRGDEVILPSHTFIATAESIRHCGARPVFVEIDEATMLMDPAAVEAAISPRTRAICAVHLYGTPCDMDRLGAIATRAGIALVEDAAQAHGASIHGRRAGTLGDGASFSFFPGKNLGALGDAGGVTTNDADRARAVRRYANHGRDSKFLHEVDGTNYRLDTIQAALLLAKLPHLEGWNQHRRVLALRYEELLSAEPFASAGIDFQRVPAGYVPSRHLFVVRIPSGRDAVREALGKRGIETGIHYPVPCHTQPAMEYAGTPAGSLPITERVCSEILSLPIGPTMTVDEVERVCAALAEEIPAALARR